MVKRILFVSPTGTLDNGAEKSIANLMIYLSENGYKIYNDYPENSTPLIRANTNTTMRLIA